MFNFKLKVSSDIHLPTLINFINEIPLNELVVFNFLTLPLEAAYKKLYEWDISEISKIIHDSELIGKKKKDEIKNYLLNKV